MDLLAVFRTFRRHWLIALPTIVLTIACMFYALAIRPTDYESTASVALLGQPSPPRNDAGEIITSTPAGKTESPLSRFGDQAVVVNIVSKAISTDLYRDKLEAAGADSRYEVGQGISGPIADVTAIATSREAAITTAQLVAAAFVTELEQIQILQGVDPAYMVTTLPVEEAEDAKPKSSSSIRLAIAVLALGTLSTFFVVSIAEARRLSKIERREREASSGDDGDEADDEVASTPPLPPLEAADNAGAAVDDADDDADDDTNVDGDDGDDADEADDTADDDGDGDGEKHAGTRVSAEASRGDGRSGSNGTSTTPAPSPRQWGARAPRPSTPAPPSRRR